MSLQETLSCPPSLVNFTNSKLIPKIGLLDSLSFQPRFQHTTITRKPEFFQSQVLARMNLSERALKRCKSLKEKTKTTLKSLNKISQFKGGVWMAWRTNKQPNARNHSNPNPRNLKSIRNRLTWVVEREAEATTIREKRRDETKEYTEGRAKKREIWSKT